MANEQTSVPLYAASEVLTAANMNISAGTGVPVFATTVTRDAAFGGASEKVLAEGQLCYLSASNIVQQYNGSGWETVGPAASGLTLISATTIGTTVSSVTVSNAFSSTYENYLIFVSGGTSSTTNNMSMILGATTTGYYSTRVYMNYNASTVTGEGQANGASWNAFYASANNPNGAVLLFGPNLAKNTIIHNDLAVTETTGETSIRRGYLANNTQYTAFTITPSTGTLTGGTIRVYGYQNS